MKIQLLGAAQTVTGSCFVIEAAGKRFAVDCGMHQGNAAIEKRNFNTKAYQAAKLDFVLLTHAHIDHSGLLPRMVREGFKGPVYCTEPTADLLDIMLLDSAHIQEMEAEWANRKRARRGNGFVEALYTTEDAAKAAGLLKAVRYNDDFSPVPGVQVCFRNAGHILGSSFFEMKVTENGESTGLIFSGDLGRPNALLMNDAALPEFRADYLFLESTYGDRNHKNESTSRDELAEAIARATANGQKTIIPAFAVERTQEVIYTLFLLHKEGKLPPGIPVYVDSPLAIKATEIFRRHPEYFDRATQDLLRNGEDPLALPGLKYTLSAEESQAINRQEGAAIVISASGMCNAGRIKHHLRHNLWREGASIVFTGYQAVGTPGRKIVDGAESLTILGDEIKVTANIHTIGGFSGHAGQSQILDWVGTFCRPELKVFLVHGEERAQQPLADLLRQRYGLSVNIPAYLEEITLEPGKAPKLYMDDSIMAARKINWDLLLAETEGKLVQLRAGLSDVRQKTWAEQAEVQEQILDLNKRFLQLLSQL
ncbi:MAG: MBL fold metallo-hydrolase [Desulfovibrionaceae bacterium]|nr:MBL fold metallo-hydrolase [Desulfovibrionaceae bacterium]